MTKYINKILTLFLLTALAACKIDEQIDPNRPSLEGVSKNATSSQLNNLVVGTLNQMRADLAAYIDAVGVVGRDHYRFAGSEPRYVSDLLTATLDNNAFYVTRPFASRYRTIKNVNILIDAVNNTNSVNEAEKQGYLGFAKTVKAHELLMVLNQLHDNGVRLDVSNPDALGAFVSRADALTGIANLLQEASEHLDKAGTTFKFSLSAGFTGFTNPANFKQFNRGLAARVAVYRERYTEALTALNGSFMNLEGDLQAGVYHVFSGSSNDFFNPLFFARNASGEVRLVHPKWLSEAEAGDKRLAKAALRNNPIVNPAGLTGTHDVWIYTTNTTPVCVLRNEELVLIYAEAQIQANNSTEAIKALNIIRKSAGLADYSGATSKDALINEMLKQRRYSLYFEGHRWVDMRRYNKLNEIAVDRATDKVATQFPKPFTEG
jgi:hypothetical protein